MLKSLFSALVAAIPSLFPADDLPRALINDNTRPAGSPAGAVHAVNITIGRARWFPEEENGRSVEALAFGESAQRLSIPGPLIRVTSGTRMRVVLSNPLRDTLTVYGLHTRPGEPVPVQVAPGTQRTVEFSAPVGTYFYWGTTRKSALGERRPEESQLSGAIVVDDPAVRRRDRVLMIGVRIQPPDSSASGVTRFHEAMVINGKSWPHTERMNLVQGDSVFWRVLNAAPPPHPMHLHGFYFRVDSRGTWRADTVFVPGQRRLAATELMDQGGTYTMAFVPTEPGNWLFHCHFAFHVSPERSLAALEQMPGKAHAHHGKQHMAGLVIGMHVSPRGPQRASVPVARDMHLFVNTAPRRFGAKPGYSFVLQRDANAPRADSLETLSSPLILTRGERVRIRVANRLPQATAVHWHGIELESFPDGVPDWSGVGKQLFTNVPANASFDAVFTPPRSGTFIYHSHLNEGEQIVSGLFGAVLVLDPGEKFDAERERVFVIGAAGPIEEGANDMGTINGEREPRPVDLVAGKTYRFRFININPEWRVQFTIGTDTSVAKWRPIAKDGADLPESQRTLRPAFLLTGPGETADFEFTPEQTGNLQLNFRTRIAGWNIPMLLRVRSAATASRD